MLFNEVTKADAQKESLNIDDMISMTKAKKKKSDIEFDMAMNQLNMAKLKQDVQDGAAKSQEKMQKINADLISSTIQKGPVAVGGDLVNQFAPTPQQPESVGLPLIEGIQQN